MVGYFPNGKCLCGVSLVRKLPARTSYHEAYILPCLSYYTATETRAKRGFPRLDILRAWLKYVDGERGSAIRSTWHSNSRNGAVPFDV